MRKYLSKMILPFQLHRLSIRSASWIGAQCVRHFCQSRNIDDDRINAFADHIEGAVEAGDLPAWDEAFGQLDVVGFLPDGLDEIRGLGELIASVREISASQMYGKWEQKEVVENLQTALNLSQYDPTPYMSLLLEHRRCRQG